MKNRFIVVVFVIASLGALLGVPACSDQGEGERCDARGDNNGNDECQGGLVCTAGSDLGLPTDRCCPPRGSPTTTTICGSSTGAVDASAAPPADAATSDVTTPADSGDAQADAVSPVDAADAADAADGD